SVAAVAARAVAAGAVGFAEIVGDVLVTRSSVASEQQEGRDNQRGAGHARPHCDCDASRHTPSTARDSTPPSRNARGPTTTPVVVELQGWRLREGRWRDWRAYGFGAWMRMPSLPLCLFSFISWCASGVSAKSNT